MPPAPPYIHLVFVDFENVPSVDLEPIATLPVFVTLLIGKNQTKLETRLVTQIHRHAAQVRLIEVGASGRNALDLVLAHYLGRAVVDSPDATLHIVSKDKDFEPLIAHLQGNNVRVSRSESFASLPFLHARRPSAPPRRQPSPPRPLPVHRPAPAPKKSAAPIAPPPRDVPDEKFEKLITRLTNHAGPRPKKMQRLLHHINTAYGNRLTDAQLADLVRQLTDRGVIRIGPNNTVGY